MMNSKLPDLEYRPAILLIAFNRPDFFKARILTLEKLTKNSSQIYIAIDGPRLGNKKDILAINEILAILESSPLYASVKLIKSNRNKGCDDHIVESIDEVLKTHNSLIVIEDDVSLSNSGINRLLEMTQKVANEGQINPIVTMSGLSRKGWIGKNSWRRSLYFSAWGFGINRDFWKLHCLDKNISNSTELQAKLEKSKNWKKISKRKQMLWLERMSRINYDYSIQRTIFLENLQTFAPIFRIADNVGHESVGATHTRHKKPKFLQHSVSGINDSFDTHSVNCASLNRFLIWIDSQTWAGDGYLSIRGRNIGIRSSIKGVLRPTKVNR